MNTSNTPVIHSSCAALGTGGLRYQDRQLLSSSLLSLYGLVPLVFSYTVVLALAPFALPWLLMMVAFPLVGEPSTQPSRSPPPTLKLTTLTLDMPVVLALAFCGSWLSVHRSSQARPRTLILTLPRSGGCPPVCSNRSTRTVARKRRASRCTHVPQLRAAPRPTSPLYVQATLASIARPCSRRRPRSRCSMRRRFQRDGRARPGAAPCPEMHRERVRALWIFGTVGVPTVQRPSVPQVSEEHLSRLRGFPCRWTRAGIALRLRASHSISSRDSSWCGSWRGIVERQQQRGSIP